MGMKKDEIIEMIVKSLPVPIIGNGNNMIRDDHSIKVSEPVMLTVTAATNGPTIAPALAPTAINPNKRFDCSLL